ncbi:MAG: hypothetical protein KKA19_02330, partial [Candidatus Margulisbacteria bacterium]|nr:hypothetical protein [Candidatus Margulisiibacteriota bacterium]
ELLYLQEKVCKSGPAQLVLPILFTAYTTLQDSAEKAIDLICKQLLIIKENDRKDIFKFKKEFLSAPIFFKAAILYSLINKYSEQIDVQYWIAQFGNIALAMVIREFYRSRKRFDRFPKAFQEALRHVDIDKMLNIFKRLQKDVGSIVSGKDFKETIEEIQKLLSEVDEFVDIKARAQTLNKVKEKLNKAIEEFNRVLARIEDENIKMILDQYILSSLSKLAIGVGQKEKEIEQEEIKENIKKFGDLDRIDEAIDFELKRLNKGNN